jgi:hypothetical protein
MGAPVLHFYDRRASLKPLAADAEGLGIDRPRSKILVAIVLFERRWRFEQSEKGTKWEVQ